MSIVYTSLNMSIGAVLSTFLIEFDIRVSTTNNGVIDKLVSNFADMECGGEKSLALLWFYEQ